MEKKRKIPVVIFVYALIIVIANLIGVYLSFFRPEFIFTVSDAPAIDANNPIFKYLIFSMGGGSIGVVFMMLVALIRRNPYMLTSAFEFGSITITISVLILSNIFGIGTVARNIVRWALLGLPQAIAGVILVVRADRAAKAAAS